ncbi:MAG: TonB-dependent receptor plug domain-containing protein, partial [Gemmatimonadaceae bacterium]|nr:TonB-dependent receptor plug domain-containing protein [Gemmatimonadaceae bacterium]
MKPIKWLLGIALLAAVPAAAEAQTVVTGTVRTDAGSALPNATVFIQELNLGTQTNASGSYTLTVPTARANGSSVLIGARIIGYSARATRISLVNGTVRQDFVMAANPLRLGEVVITGAGTVTQVEKLGSVRNNVDSTLIRRSNETNIVNALAGKAPNVEVSSASGEAGSSSFIRIRGQRTINGTGQPLFVVDGQPIDNSTISTNGSTASTSASNRASDINPNDIESVEILKGAAAAAIYGSRAGQGVVLITTKSGKAGPTRYSLRTNLTTDKVNYDYPLQRTFGQGSRGAAAVCAAAGCRLTSGSWG